LSLALSLAEEEWPLRADAELEALLRILYLLVVVYRRNWPAEGREEAKVWG
jgi:hypothetical protein